MAFETDGIPVVANTGIQDTALVQARRELTDWFRRYEQCLVAYSGGVDSSLVLKAALDALGADKVRAVLADSPSLAREEYRAAVELAASLGASLTTVKTDELSLEGYQANAGNRCYFCKSTLYQNLTALLRDELAAARSAETATVIVDGTNLDDLQDVRPGRKAAEEAGVAHPLVDCRFTKQMVRDASRELGLPNWNKPAMPCLASRITVGERVTAEKLSQVEKAEAALRRLGFKQLRVRHHESGPAGAAAARIELGAEEIDRAMDQTLRRQIVSAVKEAGFVRVLLDLDGYRTGGGNQ